MTELEPVDLQQRLVDALYGPGKRRSDTVEELADAMIAIFVSRASQQQGPEIKGLEWFKWDKRDAGSSAETIIGRYHVWTHHEAEGKWFYRLTMTGLGPTVINGECVDETEGKQKCQDHFDATIRTARLHQWGRRSRRADHPMLQRHSHDLSN